MTRRNRPRTATATLSDVARAAGVSMATASRVLSRSSYGVAEELRDRVQAAAAELDYVPNAHARALAKASSSTIGVVVHDIADPYFAEIVRGILEVATERDHLVTICHTGRDSDLARWSAAVRRSRSQPSPTTYVNPTLTAHSSMLG